MRIAGRGLVDHHRKVRFTFDGRSVDGHPGDTVASALLANSIRLVGRSFKYHRPRGIVSAGSEEPSALVTIGTGAHRRPNLRATVEEARDGLEVRSQNAWPALGFDALALNDLAAPLIPAGFYYKTFMWPSWAWEKVYEPMIRRAAGLGRLSGEAAPDDAEKAFAHCDVLVIGAGPAGLMAALALGRAGADVILAEEGSRAGGRALAEAWEIDGMSGPNWTGSVLAQLADMPNVRLMERTAVTGAYDHGTYAALERLPFAPPGAPRECFWRIVAPRAVLAAGAHERPVAFPGNDRPGVMLAGSVRAYLHRWGVSPGARVAVFGNNDDAHRTARDLADAGVEIAALIDTRAEARPDLDLPFHPGAVVTATRGRLGLRGLTIRTAAGSERIEADCLAVSGGWNPAVHLACHLGAKPVWRDDIAAFVPPPGAVPGLVAAGAANGALTTAACLADGLRAARETAAALDLAMPDIDPPEAEDGHAGLAPFWVVEAPGRAWLDLQNDVTTKDVALAAQENFRSVEHMKRYTTQGMTVDQGKASNVTALAHLAHLTGRGIAETGTTTFRPPYVPVAIATMGAGGGGRGFAPERRTVSDAAARARGAPMIEAGLWYRPSFFPAPGERVWRESCDREVRAVREAVGVADVSTLGKIEVVGPDAGAFLDFVYTNVMSTLAPGRVRYGLMLREDGHVMDDGTCARLADDRFLVTTTTAAAGQVMAHLDFVQQCLRPGLAVRFASVTEHWAQIAIAGPRADRVLAALLDDPVDPGRWPFMSCGAVRAGGVGARLFRISFSGERGWELAVPARHGEALWRVATALAEGEGGAPYGMEALNVLRIEKGFVTHAEIDGRVTADDLGLGHLMKTAKDFVGRAAAARPGLADAGRHQLVGLRTTGAVRQLTAGALLFAEGAARDFESAEGHVTSVGWSPTLDRFLGLALLRAGRSRHGEQMTMVDSLRRVTAAVEIAAPCAYDDGGGRMRD